MSPLKKLIMKSTHAKRFISLLSVIVLAGCAGSTPLEVVQGVFGYVPPPEELTIAEELRSEYERCVKIGQDDNCAQVAFDLVRKVKGLEPRTVPKGVVIILEGDGGHATETTDPETKP